MKKLIMCVVSILVGAAAAVAVMLFLFGMKPAPAVSEAKAEPAAQEAMTNEKLSQLGYEVLNAIAARDYNALASFVHPEKGVSFSPYATALDSNQCFTADDVRKFGDNTGKYIWGVYDGVGDPIELTVSDYFSQFVFDCDYTSASAIGLNYILRSGNSLENVTEAYPGCQFIDFFVPSPTSEMEDVDWHILRLVFGSSGSELKLIAVISSRYTV